MQPMSAWRRPVAEIAILGAAAVAALTPIAPRVVEDWFSTGFYPPVQRAVTSLSNLLPVALLDLLCLVTAVVVAWASARAIRSSWQTRRIGALMGVLRVLLSTAATVYIVFLLLWGLNYRRLPMTERVQLRAAAPTAESVGQLGREAIAQLNTLYADAHRAGWIESPEQSEALRRGFVATQRALSDAPPITFGPLKSTLLGAYFRWTGVDGMVNPFALEVLVNPDLLPFERPFVAAHEWAHLAGYADESEASFVGWLACLQGNASTQYSAWLFLYWQVRGEVDADTRADLDQALAPGPRRDLDAMAARLRDGELPWLRTAGWQVYDQYLKANRVEEGIRSYSAVVTLILRTRFEPGWIPIRRTETGSPERLTVPDVDHGSGRAAEPVANRAP
jgi:hypothetical protein